MIKISVPLRRDSDNTNVSERELEVSQYERSVNGKYIIVLSLAGPDREVEVDAMEFRIAMGALFKEIEAQDRGWKG